MTRSTVRQQTTRSRLLALIERDPSRSLADLAETLGVSRKRIAELLADEGYAFEPGRWVRES